jgi:tetratricopeptide (TPR) repeat protein
MNLADLLYVEFDRIQDAILLYYRILSIAPENVETLMVLGKIHMDLGLIKEAKGIYEKVLALEPNNSVSLQLYQFLESITIIESIDNAPKWLASYQNEGGFFLISKPQRFAHNEKDYDRRVNENLL